MNGSELVVRCLEVEGVSHVFGIVGKETIDLVHALEHSSVRFIPCRHENNAAFMADIYGRLTGKAGVCTSTLGPGATNMATGIGSAFLDHSPVVALTGQGAVSRLHQQSHQIISIRDLMAPISKWSFEVKDPSTIPEVIRKAFQLAEKQNPGPVVLSLPENIEKAQINGNPLKKHSISKSMPDIETLKEVKTRLDQAVSPVMIIGNGVIRADAQQICLTLAETLSIPIVHSFTAKGIVPNNHPLNYFTFGSGKDDEVNQLFSKSDLLLCIGLDFVENQPPDWNFCNTPIIHIDFTEAEIDSLYTPVIQLIAHVKESINALLAMDLSSHSNTEIDLQAKLYNKLVEQKPSAAIGPLTGEMIMKELTGLIPDEHILLSDVGANKIDVARFYHPSPGNKVIISNGFASMGISVPGAITAKLLFPEKTVVAVTGDGGFMMSVAELETAKRLGLNILIILLVDDMLGIEWQQMKKDYPDAVGVHFSNPDFEKLAESFGFSYFRAENIEALSEATTDALEMNATVVIEVPMTNKIKP
ncbi:acetolactate synthase large subunit [Bacillus salacetis]|uniref:acetolactate synthase large subunit n=1 Tax=Bacillus salacetis TaxID=2315464 RepID=UPI003BA3A35D